MGLVHKQRPGSVAAISLLSLAASSVLWSVQSPDGQPATTRLERAETAAVVGDLEGLQRLRAETHRQLSALPAGDPQEPAARYEAAYLNWRTSQLLDRKSEKKRILKEAEVILAQLLALKPDNAEAHALRGSVIGDRITGAFSGMMLGRKASAALDTAAELAPDNPRVALQRDVGYFFTPKAFGGGMEKAEAELRRAVELFETGAASEEWPYWGRVDALAWLGQVYAKTERPSKARRLYLEALGLEPEHVWIRDELLAALGE